MTSKWNELENTISLSDIVGLIDYFGKRKKSNKTGKTKQQKTNTKK